MKPYCFVLMPFGRKADEGGRVIDFDRVYGEVIRPAVAEADMEPIRADEEALGGIIHKAMFERLMLCDYAVADLTTANPNVLYELGVRHGIRPYSTVLMFGQGTRLPFDVVALRGLPYAISPNGMPSAAAVDREALAARLIACRAGEEDSPLFQLIKDWPRPDIARLRTDKFRDVVLYPKEIKDRLAQARQRGAEAVAKIEAELDVPNADPAVVIDLFLSYRATEDYARMAALVERMAPVVRRMILVREQLAFALNRMGRRDEAERVLSEVIEEHGPSSETNGLLGRVYKDRWDEARKAGDSLKARGFLRRAVETYLSGFETDWRDAYPGINAVTVMEMEDKVDPRQSELLPVVRYAVRRRLMGKQPDYWDYATLLELEVLARNRSAAEDALADALAAVREPFEPQTTARNLSLIREARTRRGEDAAWIAQIERALTQKPSL